MSGERLASDAYLKRQRLHNLLNKAMDYPLAIVCAGAGYGKTRAVESFLLDHDINTIWIQLSERDNIKTRFWESYTNMISLTWPEFGQRLSEIGFPESDEAFSQYMSIMKEIIKTPGKHIRVFDDFHLLNNPEIMRFLERAVSMIPPNVTLMLITRTVPDINLIGMIMRENVFTINEDELCFTEEEISEYFSQINLSVSRGDIRNLYDDTQGWAFAVNLIGRSLAKEQKYERYALEAMKKNIFRLIEAEISGTISESLWRFLLRISLIDHLAASLIRILAKGDDALIKEMELINSYIRYDYHMDTYIIHHLFLDYLRQEQDKYLMNEERIETYQAAGEWCDANGYHMDAYSYYEKSGDYNAITRKVALYNLQMPPDMARYTLELFERAPLEIAKSNPIFPAMHIRLKTNLGQFNEETMALARRYAEDYESRPETPAVTRALCAIYANWGIFRMLMSTFDDIYDFDVYWKKAAEYYKKSPFEIIGAYTSISAITWASLVGNSSAEAQEEYLGAVSRTIAFLSEMNIESLYGFDDLVRGELYFLKGEFREAEQYLKQAVDKAKTRDLYMTQNRALAYLMRIAFFRGDFAGVKAKMEEMGELLSEKDYGARYTIYDVVCGFFQLSMGRTEEVPEWVKRGFLPYTHPAFLENYSNRIIAQYLYQTRHYSELLAFHEKVMPRKTILYSMIEYKVTYALVMYKLKRRDEAIAALTEAYELAEPNKILIPFIQQIKDMRTLTAAALKDDKCAIPREWLENINRKASAYAKRLSTLFSEYKQSEGIEDDISLTEREIAILRDLSQGLSRTEIAASQNISVNTVKMTINIVYDKLHVASLPDAVRVAVSRGIV